MIQDCLQRHYQTHSFGEIRPQSGRNHIEPAQTGEADENQQVRQTGACRFSPDAFTTPIRHHEYPGVRKKYEEQREQRYVQQSDQTEHRPRPGTHTLEAVN